MALGVAERVNGSATHSEAVLAERTRILSAVLAQSDTLARKAVAAMRAEIPAYAAQRDQRFLDDVAHQVGLHYRANLTAVLEGRDVTRDDIAFVRAAAMRRARAGFALEDYINAFRVGLQILWEAIIACAGQTPVGQEAALALATPLMRYTDFASTHAGHAYVEFQQYELADADRERRDLLEHLLTGRLPAGGPLLAAAQAYGFAADVRMIVATAVAVDRHLSGTGSHAATAAFAEAGLYDTATLVVGRHAEIVAVPILRARADPAAVCDSLDAVRERLREDGIPLALGISTVAGNVAELPRAYREARTALESLGDEGGVAALPRLSPFAYLARRADDTARRLVDPTLYAFLAEDRGRGGLLASTIRAFADADLNMRVTAEQLHIHPNTAQYRLRRIQQRTGRNPRRIADLLELLVALELNEANPVGDAAGCSYAVRQG